MRSKYKKSTSKWAQIGCFFEPNPKRFTRKLEAMLGETALPTPARRGRKQQERTAMKWHSLEKRQVGVLIAKLNGISSMLQAILKYLLRDRKTSPPRGCNFEVLWLSSWTWWCSNLRIWEQMMKSVVYGSHFLQLICILMAGFPPCGNLSLTSSCWPSATPPLRTNSPAS